MEGGKAGPNTTGVSFKIAARGTFSKGPSTAGAEATRLEGIEGTISGLGLEGAAKAGLG